MKKFLSQTTRPRLLFYVTIAFIVAALATGFGIHAFVKGDHARSVAAGYLGLPLALLIVYLVVGYIYQIVVNLRAIYHAQGNLWRLYRHDKVFRTPVNNALACLFILINAFVNFILSFTGFQWYYLSVSAIFFVIFIMKLYLVLKIGHDQQREQHVVMWLMLFMSLACTGVVAMLWSNKFGFTARGLMIYWDALYAFTSITLAIINIVKAAKSRTFVIGCFLAVQLANAIFGMFTLTISMIMTFDTTFDRMKPMALSVGIVAAVLINAIAVTQFVLAKKLAARETTPVE